MTEYSELKRMAEAAEEQGAAWEKAGRPWPVWNSRLQDFRIAANPATVLALIADLGSKDKTISLLHSSGEEVERILDGVIAERDQLKAEVEALRKDAARYRWLRVKQTFIWLIQDWFPKDNVLTDVDAEIDAAMSKESGHD